jgi:hypothetical protein
MLSPKGLLLDVPDGWRGEQNSGRCQLINQGDLLMENPMAWFNATRHAARRCGPGGRNLVRSPLMGCAAVTGVVGPESSPMQDAKGL